MDGSTGIKRKSKVAVFEHVPKKKRKRSTFKPNKSLDDSSPSESELVIDEYQDKPRKSKRQPCIKYLEEKLDLVCDWLDCGEPFISWGELNTHIIEHATDDSDVQACCWDDCEEVFTSVSHKVQHVSYHGYLAMLRAIGENVLKRFSLPECKQKCVTNKIPFYNNGYTCMWEHCSCNFDSMYEFLAHMRIHTANNPLVAGERPNEIIACCWKNCGLKFTYRNHLEDHVRIHTKQKRVSCPACHNLFSNRTKFVDHRKRQLDNDLKSYQCSQCLKLFPGERLLRLHMRTHINHYKCSMCNMTCMLPSILGRHMRYKHIGEKPFKCDQCDKCFVAQENLRTHQKTHLKENQMKCKFCDFSCKSKVGLDNHCIREHEQAKAIYECHCCKKQVKRGGYLTRHLMKIHNFHWPSGHSRFKYRKDHDGIYRLQTVRYESLEVTKEMIASESMNTANSSHSEDSEQNNKILITIDDLDFKGNVVKSQVVVSEVVNADEDVDSSSVHCKEEPQDDDELEGSTDLPRDESTNETTVD